MSDEHPSALDVVMAERDHLRAALEEVQALHTPYDDDSGCSHCALPQPCPTRRRLDAALEGE